MSLSDVVLFSAAIPHQGGENHFNEQWPDYWSQKFERRGYSVLDCLRHLIWANPKVEVLVRAESLPVRQRKGDGIQPGAPAGGPGDQADATVARPSTSLPRGNGPREGAFSAVSVLPGLDEAATEAASGAITVATPYFLMQTNNLDREQGMMRSELEVLRELVTSSGARQVLEIGMANGSSTEVILGALQNVENGHLTSVDPFQLVDAPDGFAGEGVRRIQSLGLAHRHTLIPKMNYVALPGLLESGRTFDLVFIDGYHSLDYAMLDFVFSDLLLVNGGMLILHDASSPAVYKLSQFIRSNKPYRVVGPPVLLRYQSPVRKLLRRAHHAVSSNRSEFRLRRDRWKSLAVFVKEASGLAPQFEVHGL